MHQLLAQFVVSEDRSEMHVVVQEKNEQLANNRLLLLVSLADWKNKKDSKVIGNCVNANSDPSGVNGTKQENNGKETSTTTFRIGLGRRWK